MPRSPQSLQGAQLSYAIRRAKQLEAELIKQGAIHAAQEVVQYQALGAARTMLARQYTTSAAQLFASSLAATYKSVPQETANTVLKAIRAVERATIGGTQAEQRDNADIKLAMEALADYINDEILNNYQEQFSGRGYRRGDDARHSGELQLFLRRKLLAKAVGHDLVVSTAPAANDADVPHFFRLNYGTESLTGGRKGGVRPPRFSVSLVPGASSQPVDLSEPRRPGFMYPGKGFKHTLTLGSAGQVQLYGGKEGISGRRIGFGTEMRPSAGIAPSYFVEYGVKDGLRHASTEFQEMLNRWKRRVARLK